MPSHNQSERSKAEANRTTNLNTLPEIISRTPQSIVTYGPVTTEASAEGTSVQPGGNIDLNDLRRRSQPDAPDLSTPVIPVQANSHKARALEYLRAEARSGRDTMIPEHLEELVWRSYCYFMIAPDLITDPTSRRAITKSMSRTMVRQMESDREMNPRRGPSHWRDWLSSMSQGDDGPQGSDRVATDRDYSAYDSRNFYMSTADILLNHHEWSKDLFEMLGTACVEEDPEVSRARQENLDVSGLERLKKNSTQRTLRELRAQIKPELHRFVIVSELGGRVSEAE